MQRYLLNMSDIFKLVIEALSRPPDNPETLNQQLYELDLFLKSSDEQTLEAVTEVIQMLTGQGAIPDHDSQKLFKYLEEIKYNLDPAIPWLQYLHGPTAHYKAKNTAKLLFFTQKINSIMVTNLCSSFMRLYQHLWEEKLRKLRNSHKLALKSTVISKLIKHNTYQMEKSFEIWKVKTAAKRQESSKSLISSVFNRDRFRLKSYFDF